MSGLVSTRPNKKNESGTTPNPYSVSLITSHFLSFNQKTVLEPVFTRNIFGFLNIILSITRRKIAGVLDVRQDFSTKLVTKFIKKTGVYACEDRF